MSLYTRIKKRREALGLSQDDLALRLNYKSRSTIAKIESGANDIPQSKIKAFADALDTTPAYLMGWEEQPAPPISLKEQRLLKSFNKLNDVGQDEAVKRVEELTYINDYTKRFTTRDEAWEYLKGFKLAASGGLNLHTMTDEKLIEFANNLYEEHNK